MENIRVKDLMMGIDEIDSTLYEIYECGKQVDITDNLHALVDKLNYLLLTRFEKETEEMIRYQYSNKFHHLVEHNALKDKMVRIYNKDNEEESRVHIKEFLEEVYNHMLFKDTVIAIAIKSM